MQEPTRPGFGEGRRRWNGMSELVSIEPAGVLARACRQRGPYATREIPAVIAVWINWQLARERPGRMGWGERLAVPMKPGNSGEGKGPQLKADARSDDGKGDWRSA